MSRPWLERFVDAYTLSETVAFRVVSGFDLRLERRVVVVVACPGTDRGLAAQALDRAFEAHRDPPHAVIARAVERAGEGDVDYLVIDFAGCIDLAGVAQLASEVGLKCDYAAADGFTATLREAILASGERRMATGEPLCMGSFALSNVLFAASGEHVLIGYGHNVVCHDEHGRLVSRGRFYQAPEVIAGATPSAASDYVGMLRMSRTVVPLVQMPEAVLRILRGAALPEDAELMRLLMRFEMEAIQAVPSARLSIPEMMALAQQIRTTVGARLDPDGFRLSVARLLAERRPDLLRPRSTLRLARDAAWFELGDARTDLTPLQGRLLLALAGARLRNLTEVVSADALLLACWPAERMSRASGRNRLYVALNTLRRLGLDAQLESTEGGYRLSTDVHLEIVDH